jgi:hypothetical protein
MPSGLILALRREDDERFVFIYEGRTWAVATFLIALLLMAIAQTDVASEPVAQWFLKGMALLMLVGCARNAGSRLTLEITKADGRVRGFGRWSWRAVTWIPSETYFTELRILRGSVDGAPASNMHIVLIGRDRAHTYLRTRGFFESTRHTAVAALATRVARALNLPLADLS